MTWYVTLLVQTTREDAGVEFEFVYVGAATAYGHAVEDAQHEATYRGFSVVRLIKVQCRVIRERSYR